MSKQLKIILVILGILVGISIVSVGVIAIFFPGLPTYIECKKTYPMLDYPLPDFTEYSVTLKDEIQLYHHNNFSVHIPADWKVKTVDITPKTSITRYKSAKKSDYVLVTASNLYYSFTEVFGNTDVSRADVDAFCLSRGYDYLQNTFDYQYLIQSLTWDDFNIHNLSESKGFKAFAMYKEESFEYFDGFIYYESPSVKGLIWQNPEPFTGSGKLTANLFNKENLIQNITITGNTDDIDIFWGIVNSVTID